MTYCDYGDGEFYSDVRETEPVASKRHRCDECGGDIQPGERYTRHVGFGLGPPATWLICSGCRPAFDWVRRNCGCWYYTDLERHLDEDVLGGAVPLPPGRRFTVGRWVIGMRRRRQAAAERTLTRAGTARP